MKKIIIIIKYQCLLCFIPVIHKATQSTSDNVLDLLKPLLLQN